MPNPKRIALFGSTGSIGVNTLDVVRRHPEQFVVRFLTTNPRVAELFAQIEEFHPLAVAVGDEAAAVRLQAMNPSCEVLSGTEGVREIARRGEYDILVGALVGFAGLVST